MSDHVPLKSAWARQSIGAYATLTKAAIIHTRFAYFRKAGMGYEDSISACAVIYSVSESTVERNVQCFTEFIGTLDDYGMSCHVCNGMALDNFIGHTDENLVRQIKGAATKMTYYLKSHK